MEKVVVSGGRSEGMGWVTLLPAKLVESQINEIFTWENGKNDFTHKQGNLRCVLWILLLLYQIKADEGGTRPCFYSDTVHYIP